MIENRKRSGDYYLYELCNKEDIEIIELAKNNKLSCPDGYFTDNFNYDVLFYVAEFLSKHINTDNYVRLVKGVLYELSIEDSYNDYIKKRNSHYQHIRFNKKVLGI